MARPTAKGFEDLGADVPVDSRPSAPKTALRDDISEVVAKAREGIISHALKLFHEDGINPSVVRKDDIRHGDLTFVLKQTSSDRTQQLLKAAYRAGQIRGAKDVAEDLLEQLSKKGA
jgi:hypothetical protein